MICPYCGANNPDTVKFCSKCGRSLLEASNNTINSTVNYNRPGGYQLNGSYQPNGGFQQGYTQPGGMNNNMGTYPGKGFSVAGMVCGIVGLVFTFIPFGILTFILPIVAICLSVVGASASRAAGIFNTGNATAGLVTGIIGACFALCSTICYCSAFDSILGILGA